MRQQLQPRSGLGPCTANNPWPHQAPHGSQPFNQPSAATLSFKPTHRIHPTGRSHLGLAGRLLSWERYWAARNNQQDWPSTNTQDKSEKCHEHKHIDTTKTGHSHVHNPLHASLTTWWS